MILTIALSHMYVETKNVVWKKIFTEIATKFWSEWELRLMVIVSLILQLVLVISGDLRRRYTGKMLPYVAITAWLVYMSADWAATLVLSTLLRGNVRLQNGLIVFWTPFLLWHLGSPHNITAYSLEDCQLWRRHFLGMAYQVLAAIYIYLTFRSDSTLNYMAAPIFIAGVFKYGERIWALRSASEKQLINSLYDRKARGQRNMIRIGLSESTINRCFEGEDNVSELNLLREAYSSFIIFKPLFLGLPFGLSAKYYDEMVYIRSKSADQAFKLVGTELGYLYDLLFTKMPIRHDHEKVSSTLSALCFLSAVSSLIAFSAFVDKTAYSKLDIVITFLLLLGAIGLDIFSFIMHAFSTWAMIWLPIPQNMVNKVYSKVVAWRSRFVEARMGIKSMAQHDLIFYYVKTKTNKFKATVSRLFDTGDILQKYGHTDWKTVDCEMKEFIYSHLVKKRRRWGEKGFTHEVLENLLNGKVENVLKELDLHENREMEQELVAELEPQTADFTQRIFIWHLATGLVYYDDVDRFRKGTLGSYQTAKSLSDYMMYLVLVRPLMLPKGFSEVINEENYKQAIKFFPTEDILKMMRKIDFTEVRKRFTSAVIQRQSDFVVDSDSIEVINEASTFARILQSFVTEHQWDHEQKWELISEVWMELLVHAASRCSWHEHAQQLRHGGELLTHVALLMAHLGLTTQIHKDEVPEEDQAGMPPVPNF